MSSQELGSQAYQKALFADYNGAVQLLDKAIMKYPNDEKLLNNRCYCLLKMRDFKRALLDAERMVKQFPHYPKAYFRNAEALIAHKRYIEAETSLNKLLQINPTCIEAQELMNQVHNQSRVRKVAYPNLTNSRAVNQNFISDEAYHSDEDLNKMLEKAVSLSTPAAKKKSKKKR